MQAVADAESRIWALIERLKVELDSNKTELGRAFLALLNLYSDRNLVGHRLTSSHGTFQKEITTRGYNPRTIRGWISDYEALANGGATQSQKRAARRKSGDRWMNEVERMLKAGHDSVGAFARLLPHRVAQSAYREAPKLYHPDHGGDAKKMTALNRAWESAKPKGARTSVLE